MPAGRGNYNVSTRFGEDNVRVMQPAFAAELTSAYDATTGYSWKRLKLDTPTPGFLNPTVQVTGSYAFTADDNQTLASGTRVWLEPSPDASGWVIVGGDCCGWCADYWTRQGTAGSHLISVSPSALGTSGQGAIVLNDTVLTIPAGVGDVMVSGSVVVNFSPSWRNAGGGIYQGVKQCSVGARVHRLDASGNDLGFLTEGVPVLAVQRNVDYEYDPFSPYFMFGDWYLANGATFSGQAYGQGVMLPGLYLSSAFTASVGYLAWVLHWRAFGDFSTGATSPGVFQVRAGFGASGLQYEKKCCATSCSPAIPTSPPTTLPPPPPPKAASDGSIATPVKVFPPDEVPLKLLLDQGMTDAAGGKGGDGGISSGP